MSKPLWEELSDTADTLAISGRLDKPMLQTIRAAAVQMENWFTALQELREENDAAISRITEQDTALKSLADVFFYAGRFARNEITLDAFGTSLIDKAPFANIMEVHGLNSVGGALPAKRKKAARSTRLATGVTL